MLKWHEGEETKRQGRLLKGLLFGFISAAVILALALFSDVVRFEPKLPELFPTWAFLNLMYTCLPEELLFRGILQNSLVHSLKPRFKGAVPFGIIMSSIIFGIAHFSGGTPLVLFATLAGIVYGVCYHLTQTIFVPIGIHFFLNALHFLLLSYPALQLT